MIEGLRVFPWLHEAVRRKQSVDHLTNCGECMSKRDTQTRRSMGCGYEPAQPKAQTWTPISLDPNWRGELKTCPGYTTTLPEVVEVARARTHWRDGGGLRDFCDSPTDGLRVGVEILDGSCAEMQRWATESAAKK